MDTSPIASHTLLTHELRFESLFRPGRGYVFPCDATGQVDFDALNERERSGYLHARSLVGRELTVPALVRRAAVTRRPATNDQSSRNVAADRD